MKRFYIETFGCQMNAHDSEKVIGTLMARGLSAGRDARKKRSWSSTTPAASATRPSRRSSTAWTSSSGNGKGKTFARARLRGAAGRREDFREGAARQPGVRLGQLQQAAGDAGAARSRQPARHRPEPRHRRHVRDAADAPRQSAPRLHHDHRRLRQVVRLLRGAVHARAGAQPHRANRSSREARELAGHGLHRDPVARPEREQLSRSVARRLGFRHAAATTSGRCRASAACASPPRIRAISARRLSTPSTRIRRSATTCTCRCSPARPRVLDRMQRLYTRDEYMQRIEWMKQSPRDIAITTDIIVGFPGRDGRGFRRRR